MILDNHKAMFIVHNTLILIVYFKNPLNYFTSSVESMYLTILYWGVFMILLQVVIFLTFVPEKLKYASYFGCVILSVCLVSFWGLNTFTPSKRTTPAKPFISQNTLVLAANVLDSFEASHSYFAIRSSMKSRSEFLKVLKIAFFVVTLLSIIQGLSFYLVRSNLAIFGSLCSEFRLFWRAEQVDQLPGAFVLLPDSGQLHHRGDLPVDPV